GPRPKRSIVPGRKFWTSTSACPTSFLRTSTPALLLMSTASDRLPRLDEMNSAENSPPLSMGARLRRVMSPEIGSILMTSAPWSAKNIVANGPDTTPVKSRTRTPARGPGIVLILSAVRRALIILSQSPHGVHKSDLMTQECHGRTGFDTSSGSAKGRRAYRAEANGQPPHMNSHTKTRHRRGAFGSAVLH